METGLLEWLPDGVAVIDDRGRIVYVNRQTERLSWEGNEIEIGISAGMALFPEDGRDADALMWRADLALYTAKRHGGELALVDKPPRARPATDPRRVR
jgi:GGDEF domain-containing protein